MVTFVGVSSVPDEQLEKNKEYSLSLGLPEIGSYEAKGPLAIVGGGHSVAMYKYTLQNWRGTVWAVNGAYKWCKENGINAVFFSFDPSPLVAEMAADATSAILNRNSAIETYQALAGKPIWVGDSKDGGSTSVGAAIVMGVECGFEDITLFGCEASMQPDSTHIYGHLPSDDDLVVGCNGMCFYTTARMFIGCVEIRNMVKVCPFLKELSGGLLRAMVEAEKEPKIVGASPSMQEKFNIAA
jgi:hypothetical protein